MKISAIQTRIQNKKYNNNFKGITQAIPLSRLTTGEEVDKFMRCLSQAKYYEALDDNIYPINKEIRKKNFSLFDDNFFIEFKKLFVDFYKEMTGFPDLKKTSSKIVKEFVSVAETGARNLNTEIEGIGFDCTSSIGLQKALPGSDIDKAYVILKENNSPYLIDNFKGFLWENINQFLMSLNHRDTFPEVFTTKKIENTLRKIDKVVIDEMDLSYDRQKKYYENRYMQTQPTVAGEFNIELARHLPAQGLSKEEVKNFAYFIESVRDGYSIKPTLYMESTLSNIFQASPFVQFSNVTQIKAHDILLSTGQKSIKTKLKNREGLAREFNQFSIDKQFRFVVDMIKYISEDQSSEFSKYYRNDDDIKARYDALNNLLT